MSGEHDEPMNRQGPIRIPPPPPPRSRPSAASIRPNQMWGSPVVNTLSLPSHFASENVNRIEGTSELPAGMTTPTRSLQRPNFSSPLEETPPYRYPSAESVLSQHVTGNQDSPMQSAYEDSNGKVDLKKGRGKATACGRGAAPGGSTFLPHCP